MKRILSRPGATAGATGALLALQIAFFALLGSATLNSVTFAGQELQWGCSFKRMFGIPCPNCGMTRSVLLTLHGHLGEALRMNPAGTLLVAGTVLFSAAMFFLMFYQRKHAAGENVEGVQRRIKHGALGYAALLLFVWTAHWLYEVL